MKDTPLRLPLLFDAFSQLDENDDTAFLCPRSTCRRSRLACAPTVGDLIGQLVVEERPVLAGREIALNCIGRTIAPYAYWFIRWDLRFSGRELHPH